MEHAIRKHIKVSFNDDPSLYKKLYEKLEAILKQKQVPLSASSQSPVN
jgi:type I restriction enzyme R subunit